MKIILTIAVLVMILVISSFSTADAISPKKQFESGIPIENIICNEDKVLVLRPSGIPACVKPTTAERFEDKGWMVIKTSFENQTVPNTIKTQVAKSEIETIPASSGSIVNFYITDNDLNLAQNAIETVPTEGLFEFTINGVPISGPEKMIETGFDTGRFFVKLQLPDTINGKPLQQDDVVLIRYLDETDFSGEPRVLTKSFALSNTFAKVETSGNSSRIGHEFTVRIYEPDANTDSKDEDKIPLTKFEYRGEGGIRTTLANPRFDANSGSMIETGPNTSTFEVKIKIPRELDGRTVHIGDWYEIRYIDRSTPSGTEEKIIFKGRIG